MQYYLAPFGPTAVTVAVDMLEVTPSDDKPVWVWRCIIGQTTELGDAADEQIEVSWVRGNTTTGSGGVAAAAPKPIALSSPTAGFTFEALNTTAASAGTAVTVHHDFWGVLAGYNYVMLPEERPDNSQATLLCWRLGAAPADSVTMGGAAVIAEVG